MATQTARRTPPKTKAVNNTGLKKPTTKKKPAPKKSQNVLDKIRDLSSEQLTYIGYGICALYALSLLYRYYRAVWWLEPIVITNNILFILICIAVPFGVWAYSTKFDKFNFHRRKRALLYTVIGTGIMTLIQPTVYLSNHFIVAPKIMEIPVTENMTKGMVLMLGRIVTLIVLGVAFALVYMPVRSILANDAIQEKINVFRITHHIDDRENKDAVYDMKIIRDLETGVLRVIKESDRFLHIFCNGASGTGKTSSTIIPQVANDLNQKLENRTKREEKLLEMVKEGKCFVVGPVRNITEYNVKPKEKYKDEYKALYKRYPDCGMTIMAPNNSMNDDIVKICEAKGIPVNVLDPAKTYSESVARRVGLNPFYIPIGLSEKERVIAINDASTNFSEVIVATNEQNGPSDQYFRDINTSVTQNIAACVMLANNIRHKQSSITEVQQCINNFSDLEPYVQEIETYYQMHIDVDTTSSRGKKTEEAGAEKIKEKKVKSKAEMEKELRARQNPYYETLHFIKQELLGPGQEKMFDQARGLRNLINKILLDPRYKELLSADPSWAIDFSKTLKNCEVTVINTGMEFGQQMSTAFGLFTLLTFATQVYRRPKDIRPVHFLWIDEGAQYLHKVYDDMINLWRQFKVGVFIAMQKVSQMERNQSTAYLKDVILGAGIQIVFGRVSAEEMKLYSELAGLENTEIVQKSSTMTSLATDQANQTVQERTTAERSNILEGHDIRVRDFQEVTVFSVDQGRVQTGYLGKVNFVNREEFEKMPTKRVNWAKFVKKRGEVKLSADAKKQVNARPTQYKKAPVTIHETNKAAPVRKPVIEETVDLEEKFLVGVGSLFDEDPAEIKAQELVEGNNEQPTIV